MKQQRERMKSVFNTDKLWSWINRYTGTLGQKLVYSILLLFYAYKRSDTPSWAKNIIIGAIAYIVSPIDSIPDLTPFLGLTDDIGVLSFGLVSIACYINEEVREKALIKLHSFFDDVDPESIAAVNQTL